MQNTNQPKDQYDQDENIPEYKDEESEQERQQKIKQRIKARKQFRSPLFIVGVAFLLLIVIYPRCTYKDNVRKEMERKAQNQAEIQKNKPQQNQGVSQEEQGMVPKF